MEPTIEDKRETFDIESVLTDTSNFRYTKIDTLDEDPEYPYGGGLKYAVVSNITPEGLLNCKLHGSKIKGAFRTLEEAEKCVQWFRENNPSDIYFDIGIQRIGVWTVVDQSLKAEKIKYHDDRLDAIMNRVADNQLTTLNELVGRHKEQIDESKVEHDQRLVQSVKQAVEHVNKPDYEENTMTGAANDIKQIVTNNDIRKPNIVSKARSADAIKERLRKKLDAKKGLNK